MIKRMDADGDGTVTKDEYRIVHKQMHPEDTEEDFTKLWDKLDADGDGDLTVQELAAHYGFAWDNDSGAVEMTDDQILEALRLNALLMGGEPKTEAPAEPVAPAKVTRDPTIKMINSDLKKNKDVSGVEDMIKLDEALQLGDLEGHKDKADVVSILEKDVNVRYSDEKGEMPMHKLARYKVTDKNYLTFRKCFKDLVDKMIDQKKKATKVESIASDINYQDKQGKTPLHVAIEHKNIRMIDLLYGLGKDGPDSLLVNSNGWTILHTAVHANDLEVLKNVFKHFSVARKKILITTKDKTGRTPLHIASFKDDSEGSVIINFLLEQGAKNDVKDSAGNCPSELASRSGRRESKEIIEQKTGTQNAAKDRRRSRDSAEEKA